MIILSNVNLLESKSDGLINQMNCFNQMNDSFSHKIREYYPELWELDVKTKLGDEKKLGTYGHIIGYDEKHLYNCYGQYMFGYERRHLNYEEFYNALSLISNHAIQLNLKSLSVPYNIGCIPGSNGSWKIVSTILEDIFFENPLELHICKF